MVVKIMVPFVGPYYNTGPNTGPNLGDPKRDHNSDNLPYILRIYIARHHKAPSCVKGHGLRNYPRATFRVEGSGFRV